jgi:hypothetical protein
MVPQVGLLPFGTRLDQIVLINFALGVLLPMLTAFVTKRLAGSSVKGVILLLLSAIGGFLTQYLSQDSNWHWKTAVFSFALTFIAAVGTHYGLLKPTGVTGTNGAIQVRVPGGIGGTAVAPGAQPVAPDTSGGAPS